MPDARESSAGTELGRFLRARRAQLSPGDVGLTAGTGLRRTPGLRREELAALAGVSVDYYIRLERGKETRPSVAVIDALARALRLDPPEHEHLHELAVRAGRTGSVPPIPPSRTVSAGLHLMLEKLRPFPAHVVSRSLDVLAANLGGLRLLAGLQDWPARQRNIARYVFLHPAARQLFTDWDNQVRTCVAGLHAQAGINPDAPDLTNLAGELLLKSKDFARLWERYDVRGRSTGQKTFRHPDVGTLTLGYQGMKLNGTPGQTLVTYYAEPGTPAYDALVLLDMAATDDAAATEPATPQQAE